MTVYYFDASALVKYYVLEPGTTWVRGIIDAVNPRSGQPLHLVTIAEATVAEGAAAFAILYRTQRLSRHARDAVFRALMADIVAQHYHVITVLPTDFHGAAHLTQRYPLKAYDAVQLAVALRYARILPPRKLRPTFISGDGTLLTAAQAEGLPTDNPFDHIAPQDTPAPPP